MILKYGSAYAHANNEVSVSITKTSKYTRGRQSAVIETWRISGFLQAASQAALTTAINDLETGYSANGRDLTLYLDDGTTKTSHEMVSSSALGGTIVLSPPSFPIGDGAEYSTFRRYEIVVEAETLVTVGLDDLIEFSETLSLMGGGSRFVILQTLTGTPQKQVVAEQTPYKATQRGRAVGQIAYPIPPNPTFPNDEHRDQRQIDQSSPRRIGPTYTDYPVRWSYSFESVNALSGSPQAG